jgi:FKBP-type peptidyl-prolyl cis-trans isomerase 2/predicted Fe-Mo cluster-binding NifX family protein
MRIAVTYENGEVFQHFGHTEQFKVYEVQDGKIVSSRVIGSDGAGHGALASLLAEKQIDVLICGGIGGGAVAALNERGVELVSGASGSADAAVEAYLRGELQSTGANCDHHGEGHTCGDHHEEGHTCGRHEEGGCGGGCHGAKGKNAGKTVRVHYRGTFNDGTQFDSSYDRGEPLTFVCGAGMMIPGFDAAVADMEVGEIRQVHLLPHEAYGEADPAAVFTVPLSQLPGAEELETGERVQLQSMDGRAFPVTVTAKDADSITFDANHEMAGKELNFTIELLSAE